MAELHPDVGTKVLLSEDGRGNGTLALKAFAKGELIFKEPPLALVYSSYDAPWLKAMRVELEKQSDACAWQFCVAAHCLTAEELPNRVSYLPGDVGLMSLEARRRMEELCGVDYDDGLEPSELADTAAQHILAATGEHVQSKDETRNLARLLDTLGARVSRNGFQIMDLSKRPPTSADGLFHRISFCNHCCAGLNNASWTWDGTERMLSLKASRDIAEGEELTISYIAKPWSDLGKPARQRYLQQNFNFTCLCKACTLPPEEEEALRKQLSSQRDSGKQKKPQTKLANLLMRWMEDGHEMPRDEDPSPSAAVPPAERKKEPKRPLTDEDRLNRVLERCESEAVAVSAEQARVALLAEEGHVGKTMIRLRRQVKEAAAGGAAETDSPATSRDQEIVSRTCELTSGLYVGAAIAVVGMIVVARHRFRM